MRRWTMLVGYRRKAGAALRTVLVSMAIVGDTATLIPVMEEKEEALNDGVRERLEVDICHASGRSAESCDAVLESMMLGWSVDEDRADCWFLLERKTDHGDVDGCDNP